VNVRRAKGRACQRTAVCFFLPGTPVGLSALDSRPFWQKGYGPVANAGNLRMRIYTPRVVADRIMMQDDFVRLHKFLLETDAISDISDDVREVVECTSCHRRNRMLDRPTPRGAPPILKDHITAGKVGAVLCRQIRHVCKLGFPSG
jgi:hypothetical protein